MGLKREFISWLKKKVKFFCLYQKYYYLCGVEKKFFDVLEKKWLFRLSVRTPGFHPGETGSTPVGATIDNGFPHSPKVDSSEWNRNSSPFAEASLKLRKQLRLERDGYSIIINDIVLFLWDRNEIVGRILNVILFAQHRGVLNLKFGVIAQ